VSADHLTFNVLDKDLIGKGDFLGQAVLDVRFPLRANGTYTLPLMPGANEAKDFEQLYLHHGLGRLVVQTEWLDLEPHVPFEEEEVDEY